MATKRGDMEEEHYINLEPDSRGITEYAEFSQEQVVRQPSDDRSCKKKLVKRLVLVLKIIGLLLSIVAVSFVTSYVMRNEFIGFCSTNPCQNGGTCTDFTNGYSCACATGFEGKDCDANTDECASQPCQYGNCTDDVDRYDCVCEEQYTGRNCELYSPVDCYDILLRGNNVSGVYDFYLNGVARQVYCDQDTDGGGWLVFQRRCDGSENFYREWNDYEQGFGDLENEFWIGNAFLANIMNSGNYTLRVDLESFNNGSRYAMYNVFSIGPAKSKYRLHIGGYVGTAGDSLWYNNGHPFQTKGQSYCATICRGGWWYVYCSESNLNGMYTMDYTSTTRKGIYWYHWLGRRALKKTEMKIRPRKTN